MSRRDDLHYPARRALERDGWVITNDPLNLKFRGTDLMADLGAQQPMTAEKEGQKIAIEIKDFDGNSPISDLEKTIGQLQFYQWALDENQPERELFLAVSKPVYNRLFRRPIFKMAVKRIRINLMIFDVSQEVILRWIKQEPMPTS